MPDVPIILVGCKSDAGETNAESKRNYYDALEEHKHSRTGSHVSTAKGLDIADSIGAYHFFECSAETNEGIDEIFRAAVEAALSDPRCPWDARSPSRVARACCAAGQLLNFGCCRTNRGMQQKYEHPLFRTAVESSRALFKAENPFVAGSVAGDTYTLNAWVGIADLHAQLVEAHPSLGNVNDFKLFAAATTIEVPIGGMFTLSQAMAMQRPGRFTLLFSTPLSSLADTGAAGAAGAAPLTAPGAIAASVHAQQPQPSTGSSVAKQFSIATCV